MIVETLYDHLNDTTTNIHFPENIKDELDFLRERVIALENSIEHIVSTLRDSPFVSSSIIPSTVSAFQSSANMGIFPALIHAPAPTPVQQSTSSFSQFPYTYNSPLQQRSSATKFTKSKMDQICFKLFIRSPEPTPMQLRFLVGQIAQEYPQIESKTMLSLVRKWFRKKREEVGLKAFQHLKRRFPFLADEHFTAGSEGRKTFEKERNSLLQDHLAFHNSSILKEMASVPGIEEGEVRIFVLKKIRKFCLNL